MSLMNLLTVGHSLVKGSNQPSPYRMKQQNLLPKFATVGRPISLAPPPRPVETPKDLFRSVRRESAGAVPAAAAVALAPVSVAKTASSPVATGPAPVRGKKGQLVRRLFRARCTLQSEGRLVQSELSLDGVKVVCNDLSDTDFLVMAPKPVATPAPAPQTVNAADVVSLWKRWTSRLVGAMRTII